MYRSDSQRKAMFAHMQAGNSSLRSGSGRGKTMIRHPWLRAFGTAAKSVLVGSAVGLPAGLSVLSLTKSPGLAQLAAAPITFGTSVMSMSRSLKKNKGRFESPKAHGTYAGAALGSFFGPLGFAAGGFAGRHLGGKDRRRK